MDKALYSPLWSIAADEKEAIEHLKQTMASGKHWYIALLEAIGLWTTAEEVLDGRKYRYLIANEAFDWLLLAERLCTEAEDLIPEKEKEDLLFHGKPPIELTDKEFRQLIGAAKYRSYLNYLYGITVEEALMLAVEQEVRKEQCLRAHSSEKYVSDEAYRRIYGASHKELLARFRAEKGYPEQETIEFAQLKEFTYWLFKYRLKNCDRARVASDTKKALNELHSLRLPKGLQIRL
jgi:hypothetical protein